MAFLFKELEDIEVGIVNCMSCHIQDNTIKRIQAFDDIFLHRKRLRGSNGTEMVLCKKCRKRLGKILLEEDCD